MRRSNQEKLLAGWKGKFSSVYCFLIELNGIKKYCVFDPEPLFGAPNARSYLYSTLGPKYRKFLNKAFIPLSRLDAAKALSALAGQMLFDAPPASFTDPELL